MDSSPTPTRHTTCARQMFAVLVAAFALSLVHTGYAWAAGLENPDFHVRSPFTWVFYALAFAMATLSLRSERWAQWTVLTFLAAVLAIGIFVYPQSFEPHQQTVFGWFENDVYIGLLIVAGYLGIVRLRNVVLHPLGTRGRRQARRLDPQHGDRA